MGMPCRNLPRTRCRHLHFPSASLVQRDPVVEVEARRLDRAGAGVEFTALEHEHSSTRAAHVPTRGDNEQERFPDCQPGRGPMVAILPVRLTPRSTERVGVGPGAAVPSVNAATFHMQNQSRKAGRHRGMNSPFLWRCHNAILHDGLGETRNGASSSPRLRLFDRSPKKKRGRTIRECGFPTSLRISTYFGTCQRSPQPWFCLQHCTVKSAGPPSGQPMDWSGAARNRSPFLTAQQRRHQSRDCRVAWGPGLYRIISWVLVMLLLLEMP